MVRLPAMGCHPNSMSAFGVSQQAGHFALIAGVKLFVGFTGKMKMTEHCPPSLNCKPVCLDNLREIHSKCTVLLSWTPLLIVENAWDAQTHLLPLAKSAGMLQLPSSMQTGPGWLPLGSTVVTRSSEVKATASASQPTVGMSRFTCCSS